MNTLHLQSKNLKETRTTRELTPSTDRAFHELQRHETKDVLKQLEGNIRLLEDLSGRLGFVLSEVRGLIRR